MVSVPSYGYAETLALDLRRGHRGELRGVRQRLSRERGFCGACGHRLGVTPEEPVNITVRVVDPQPSGCLSGCWSCFTMAIAVVVTILLVTWFFSC